MQTITNVNDELYGNMVEALNKFYWDNSIAPIVTAARLDKFASEVSRLAQFIRTNNDGLESAAEQSVHPTAFGARLRARLANWLFDMSTYLSQSGGG